jgi:hypothetical protein
VTTPLRALTAALIADALSRESLSQRSGVVTEL